jgi:hypothetical protein
MHSGTWRRSFAWGGIAFLVLFIVSRPSVAAQTFTWLGQGIVHILSPFEQFFRILTSGQQE